MDFDWSDLAFGNKKAIKDLRATFITAPREISAERFVQLVKQYLPTGNIIIGLAKEDYVLGLEDQPHFKMLKRTTINNTLKKVNTSKTPYKLYTLQYFQRELPYILDKLTFIKVLLVNGSWHHAFHTLEPYYTLARKYVPYEMVSPFTGEVEALAYEKRLWPLIQRTMPQAAPTKTYSAEEMIALAQTYAKQSYDYCHQTGLVLGKKQGSKYHLIGSTFNKVSPYQTYALLHGASREIHFSPPHDLNHYDTVHAEVELLIKAQKERLDLKKMTVFINLLPCPPCARMLADTDIAEVVYALDHSDGYAIPMLEKTGKTIRRIML